MKNEELLTILNEHIYTETSLNGPNSVLWFDKKSMQPTGHWVVATDAAVHCVTNSVWRTREKVW